MTELSMQVAAPAERVWRALTAELTDWFAEQADVSAKSFDFWGRYTIGTPDRAGGVHPVLAWEPERLVRFAWRYKGADTIVAIALAEAADRTIVRVRHEGVPPRPDGPGMANFWGIALANMRAWVELAKPLPMLDLSGDCHGGFRFAVDVEAPAETVFATMHEQQAGSRAPGETWSMDVGRPGSPVPIGLELLSLEPMREMRIGWTSGDLTSVVTWTLEDSEGRTRMTIVHSGMDPAHDAAGEMQGWFDAGAMVIKYLAEYGGRWHWSNPIWQGSPA